MKAKDKVKKSRSWGVKEWKTKTRVTVSPSGHRPDGSARLLNFSTAKSSEQSGNVIENKGQLWKIQERNRKVNENTSS